MVKEFGPEKVTGAVPVLWLCAALLLPTSLLSGILFVLLGSGLRRRCWRRREGGSATSPSTWEATKTRIRLT